MCEPNPSELVRSRDPSAIAAMFDRISGTYDVMNRVMSFGRDRRWRRLAVDQAMLIQGESALDVATGTGDVTRELARRVGERGRVVGIDVAEKMLAIARNKTSNRQVTFEAGDVAECSYENEFDAVTVAFGFRNFADREGAMHAMTRALKPRGRLVILELVPSRGPLKPALDWYENRVIPLIGGLIARDRTAYRYLPQSVAAATTSEEIELMMRRAGLIGIRTRSLNVGTVAIVRGVKPA